MPAQGYLVLSQEQVDKLKIAEGSAYGSILPKLLDDALSVALGELPANIPQSQISGLVAALAAKQDAAKLVSYDSAVSVGGSATETLTVTGLAVGDVVLAITEKTVGANVASLRAFGTVALNALPVTFTADPGAGAVVRVLVRKA